MSTIQTKLRQTADSPLVRRLSASVPLDDEDVRALEALAANPRDYPKGAELIEVGDEQTMPFVLLDGFVIVSRSGNDGDRMIIDLLIPGDLANVRSIVLERTDMIYVAASGVTLSRFGSKAYFDLLTTRPRLGTALIFNGAVDRSLLAERLYSVGRRSGYQRLGHFLLEFLMRMERGGLAEGNAFRAPLMLSTLADLLGMTLEHVSRLMQRQRRNGLVRTDRDRIEIVDIDALAKECDFDPYYLHRSESPKPLHPQ
jgi:CRP-like cAMP-binding protein